MSEPVRTTPAGWYDDFEQPGMQRWWDGQRFTDARQPKAAPLPERNWLGFKKPPVRSFGEKVLRFIVALVLLPIVIVVIVIITGEVSGH